MLNSAKQTQFHSRLHCPTASQSQNPWLNRRIYLLIYIMTCITSKEESRYSSSSLRTQFWATEGNRLWFTKANSHETVIRLKVRDRPSDSGLIYNTLENKSDKENKNIVIPGNILWTGVAMLMSWRCFSVSVWKSRSVDPVVKAIQTPTPATAMWEMTIPSSWWASKWLCKKNKDSVGRWTIIQPSLPTLCQGQSYLSLRCSRYVLTAAYHAFVFLLPFFLNTTSLVWKDSQLLNQSSN